MFVPSKFFNVDCYFDECLVASVFVICVTNKPVMLSVIILNVMALSSSSSGSGYSFGPLFILAVHIAIASPLLPLAFSSFGGRGVGGGVRRKLCGAGRKESGIF